MSKTISHQHCAGDYKNLDFIAETTAAAPTNVVHLRRRCFLGRLCQSPRVMLHSWRFTKNTNSALVARLSFCLAMLGILLKRYK